MNRGTSPSHQRYALARISDWDGQIESLKRGSRKEDT